MPSDSATERYWKYYESASARDKIDEEDLDHVLRADRLENAGKVKSQFRQVALKGSYPVAKVPGGYQDLGRCLRVSLREIAGIDVTNLPDWVRFKDLPGICQELGMEFLSEPGKIEVSSGEKLIFFYQTQGNRAHAVAPRDIGEFLKQDRKIFGVIRFKEEQR